MRKDIVKTLEKLNDKSLSEEERKEIYDSLYSEFQLEIKSKTERNKKKSIEYEMDESDYVVEFWVGVIFFVVIDILFLGGCYGIYRYFIN